MANSLKEMPSDMRESQGDEYYCCQGGSSSKKQQQEEEQQQKSIGIKVIPRIGVRAGINKNDFDITLDENSQQWFDRIFQYWKQCKYSVL